jgi:hypothetical protein
MLSYFTYNLHKNGTNGLKWIDFIKKTFDEIGLSFIFTNQLEINPNWIKVHKLALVVK